MTDEERLFVQLAQLLGSAPEPKPESEFRSRYTRIAKPAEDITQLRCARVPLMEVAKHGGFQAFHWLMLVWCEKDGKTELRAGVANDSDLVAQYGYVLEI